MNVNDLNDMLKKITKVKTTIDKLKLGGNVDITDISKNTFVLTVTFEDEAKAPTMKPIIGFHT